MSKIFELIHVYMWGPFGTSSIHGHQYFLTVLDDFSRYKWVFLLKSKLEVSTRVKDFVTLARIQFDSSVKFVRTNNGP